MPPAAVVALLAAGVGVLLLAAVVVGSSGITVERVIDVTAARWRGNPIEGPDDFIVWNLRLPRATLAALVGAALAVAGALAQALVRNPIADPYVLGLSSGAAVAAVSIITAFEVVALSGLTLPLGAFLGAACAGLVVVAASMTQRRITANRLVLVGVAVAQLLAGVMSLIIVSSGDPAAAQQVMAWLLGSLAGATWGLAAAAVLPTILGIAAAFALSRRLDLLMLGDDAIAAAGASPTRSRIVVFGVTALLTGAAVAVSGTIGFVGLIVPHVARLLVGSRHTRVIPVSALLGSALVVVADTIARTVLAPSEVPIGIFTAFIGVPIFLALLGRSRQVLT